MNRTQRILVAIGIGTLAAMAAPYAIRAIVDRQVTADKAQIYRSQTYRPNKDLVLCLIKHPGALNLTVTSNDVYSDPATGLAIKVDERHDFRVVTAWLPKGAALTPAQAAQLKDCVTYTGS